jgi:hypothetical protein
MQFRKISLLFAHILLVRDFYDEMVYDTIGGLEFLACFLRAHACISS